MVGLQVRSGGGEVAAQPGGVEPHGLQRLLHRALRARRLVRAEELLDLLGTRFRRKVFRSGFHQPGE